MPRALCAPFVPLLLLALLALPGCRQDDAEGLVATIDAFYASIEKGDVEARVALLADDVILMPNRWTRFTGKEEVAKVFRSSAANIFQLRERQMLRLEFSGNLAYTVNAYDYTYHAPDAPEQWHRTKNVDIWRRDDAGDWKLTVDIWNSDVPLEDFENE